MSPDNTSFAQLAGNDGVLPVGPDIDLPRAERAIRDLLTALGVDVTAEEVRDTPRRVSRSFAELLSPKPFRLTTFPNEQGYDQLILASDIAFHSLCAHHLLPFIGAAHVAYIPADRIVGLSKLARIVDLFARGLQVQEHMTEQIAKWLQDQLNPKGVGVVLEAEHTCMSIRGVTKPGSRMVTSSLHGVIRDDSRTRQEFLSLAGVHRRDR